MSRVERAPISVLLLRQLLRLDPETGFLYRPNGKRAGSADGAYRSLRLYGRKYWEHRICFALHHGHWPAGDVDHADGDSSNNRPENLRDATPGQNLHNARIRAGSSQFKGVSWFKPTQKWQAYANKEGRRSALGYFDDEEAAARAYDAHAQANFGVFARLNFPVAA